MFEQEANLFVEVILPLALPGTFTYHVPSGLMEEVTVGQRVMVQFGKQKIYTALVKEIHTVSPVSVTTKPIMGVVDEAPIVTNEQFQLWQWMADYYLCGIGEVMAAALPSAFRLQSETTILLNEEFVVEEESLNEREWKVVQVLKQKKQLTVAETSKLLSLKQAMPVIKSLIAKNIAVVAEELAEKYKPKIVNYVQLTAEAKRENYFEELIPQLEKRSPKQLDLLLSFIRLQQDQQKDFFAKSYFLKISQSAEATLQALVKKNVFEIVKLRVDREHVVDSKIIPPFTLSAEQQTAYDAIKENFRKEKTVLLNGVTSSGKTEIYIQLIEETLLNNKQALYLVPEIALTTQVITRLRKHFGNKLLVYHSRFSDNERVETWNKVLDYSRTENPVSGQLVVGARSAVFLPFSHLDLIVVDEEHDSSYKQNDPSPRYNARDTAVVLGTFFSANVLLGSATPSLESYYNALSKKYELVELDARYGDLQMPTVEIVDVQDAWKRKLMHSHFSDKLLAAIKDTLGKNRQVILFQNRRGFAPVLECKNCSWIPHCINCDVSLTLHKQHQQLRCHYCGYSRNPPTHCEACNSRDMRMKGFGTEKVEEELQVFFPDHKIARLDLDTTRTKNSYHRLLNDFENGNIDILVGTQMVTKGLDFENVSLVGILNADQLLNYPDFRAHERSFQLMEQVSGRAGRKQENGKVIIQTYHPEHAIINCVTKHDYKSFYNMELNERNRFNYPPYYRLIECSIKHKDKVTAEHAAHLFTKELKEVFGKRVLGPTTPAISRIRSYHIRQVMIKLEKKILVPQVKQKLQKAIDFFKQQEHGKGVIITIDVDPL